MTTDLLIRAADLRQQGHPFALATVVRCEPPTSARPGSRALIHPNGRLEGWVGGSCATPIVVREALRTLAVGRPRLVRLRGAGEGTAAADEGHIDYPMACHSGGTLEIYVEPHLPAPRLFVVGQSPVTRALVSLGSFLGFATTLVDPDATASELPGANAVLQQVDELAGQLNQGAYLIVASFGEYDEQALEQALKAELAYLALVASPRRAAAVREELRARGISAAAVERIRAPAGLNLGAIEPEEIALSIMAEITQLRRRKSDGLEVAPTPVSAELAIAIDPVCGMSVEIATARHVADLAGLRSYFCCPACKRRFLAEQTIEGGD